MWNTLEVRNNLTKTIAKELALVLFAMAIILVVTGCAPKPVEVIESSTTPITDVNKEPTSPSKPSPETPPATPVETKTAIEKVFDLTPNVEGLTKTIMDEQVVYLADSNNPYNLESGVYAGFYKENVEVEGVKTGGICLLPEVVLNLIRKDTSKVIIPIGVENNEENASLHISTIAKKNVDRTRILVKSKLPLKIVGACPIEGPISYYFDSTFFEVTNYFSDVDGDVSMNVLYMLNQYIFENTITNETKSFFTILYLSEGNLTPGLWAIANFGEILIDSLNNSAVTSKAFIIYNGDSLSGLSTTTQDLVMIEDKPVFINTFQSRIE